MIGDRIGHYRVVSVLGQGGMGVVYKARDDRLQRWVAVKCLPAGRFADPKRRERLVQEARSISALNHPNIGQCYVRREDLLGRP